VYNVERGGTDINLSQLKVPLTPGKPREEERERPVSKFFGLKRTVGEGKAKGCQYMTALGGLKGKEELELLLLRTMDKSEKASAIVPALRRRVPKD